MSELLDICEAIINMSHGGKPRGLSPIQASILASAVGKAMQGESRSLEEEAPEMFRKMADYWERRRWESQIADLEHDLDAHRLAVRLNLPQLRGELADLEADIATNSEQHRKGLERMGSGNRPTAAAVAGEAAAYGWERKRLLERAIQIHKELGQRVGA